MTVQFGTQSKQLRSLHEKAVYSRKARKKLTDSKARLDRVSAAIRCAIESGSLNSNDKLELAQWAMEKELGVAAARLEMLQKSSGEEWQKLRDELEDAWEDLSQSINKLVTRMKDESAE